jgi:uncharacterized RDD family membrane protein YckC
MIDTTRLVETPEGVDIHLTPAGPIARAEAWLLDLMARLLILAFVLPLMALLGVSGAGLYFLALFAISWLYFLLFEVLGSGATPGKRVMGLKALHDDGTPLGWPAGITRNLLRSVDALPVCYAAGLVSMLSSRDFRRLGDLAAGTIVVHAESPPRPVELPPVAPQAPPLPLDADARRAIVDFAQRAGTLTPERSAEIAALLRPLTGARDGASTLAAYAAWIVGRQ